MDFARRTPPRGEGPGAFNREVRRYSHAPWDDAGENIIEHLTGLEDFEAAEATCPAAVKKPALM
jgi:hypothetical protein